MMAKDSLHAAQDRQARNANRHRQEDSFHVGDQVLLSTAHLQTDAEKRRPLRKLQSKFVGPYIISSVISPTAYKLDLPASMRVHPVFHISLLRRYHPAPQEFASRVQAPPPPIEISGQDAEYEVQAILDKRTHYRKVQYLVHWKGYPAYDATWEPLDNLKNAQDAIARFENSGRSGEQWRGRHLFLDGGECSISVSQWHLAWRNTGSRDQSDFAQPSRNISLRESGLSECSRRPRDTFYARRQVLPSRYATPLDLLLLIAQTLVLLSAHVWFSSAGNFY